MKCSSPNIAKSFHVGHLRSTIICALLADLYRASSWDSGLREVHLARVREKRDSAPARDLRQLGDVDADKDPKMRDEAAAFFKLMEDSDEEAIKN
ncbi:hypothetical protein C8Q74DRAFT_1372558 [Fomes fomentarius]|nr:hypothetical protein C8Q74DRAFT_1372558 [Fomes fomentarius]